MQTHVTAQGRLVGQPVVRFRCRRHPGPVAGQVRHDLQIHIRAQQVGQRETGIQGQPMRLRLDPQGPDDTLITWLLLKDNQR